MRRSFLVLATGLFLSLAALAKDAPTDISFYYPVAVGGGVASQISRLVDEFHREHPDVHVTPIYTGTYKESIVKALTAHKNNEHPVMSVLFAADMYTLIDADAIVPFENLAKSPEDKAWLDGFYSAFMANSRVAGKTWGIPFQRSTILLYWNKEMFRDAGLDPNRAPANWQEMTEFAKKLTIRDTSGNSVQWGLQIPASGFPYWLFQGLATANGVELVNAAGTRTFFDNPAAIDALRYWVDLSRVHKVHPPGIVEWGKAPDDFFARNVAMIWTTSGNLANVKKNAPFDFGVAMLPANVQRGSPTGGGNFYIFSKTTPAQQAAAFKFIRWMTAPERTAQWSIDSGYVAVRPEAWQTNIMRNYTERFPAATVSRDQLSFAVAELSTHENQRVTRALNRGLEAALTGAKSPEQALRDAQADAVRILRPYQR